MLCAECQGILEFTLFSHLVLITIHDNMPLFFIDPILTSIINLQMISGEKWQEVLNWDSTLISCAILTEERRKSYFDIIFFIIVTIVCKSRFCFATPCCTVYMRCSLEENKITCVLPPSQSSHASFSASPS